MLHLPEDYVRSLEEVQQQSLSRSVLETIDGKRWLRRIAEDVRRLSLGLTVGREDFLEQKYLKDARLRNAYAVYFMSTNLLKLWPPLRELAYSGFFSSEVPIKHLDLGSGPGTAVWALNGYLAAHIANEELTIRTIATDVVRENLHAVNRFWSVYSKRMSRRQPSLKLYQWQLGQSVTDDIQDSAPFDLITMMNVINEVSEPTDEMLCEQLWSLLSENGAIVMVEPSARIPSRRALRFRDRMVAAGFHVYSPCVREGCCPALAQDSDWCHTSVEWERPYFIQAIDELVGNLRLSLKSTCAVFLKRDLNLSDILHGSRDFNSVARVVSDQLVEKGRIRAYLCNEKGRLPYQMNKRDSSRSNHEMSELHRYDLVQIDGVEMRASDVKVGQEAFIHRIVGPDGCGYVDNLAK